LKWPLSFFLKSVKRLVMGNEWKTNNSKAVFL
jgi:hypothetical protein